MSPIHMSRQTTESIRRSCCPLAPVSPNNETGRRQQLKQTTNKENHRGREQSHISLSEILPLTSLTRVFRLILANNAMLLLRSQFFTMVATAATSSFLSITPLPSELNVQNNLGGSKPSNLDTSGTKSKSSRSGRLQVKSNAQAPRRINGSGVGLSTAKDGVKSDGGLISSPPPRTFINQLPDWSMLLAAITTIFLAAEKQWMMLEWKPRRPDMLIDTFGLGRIVQDGFVFSQNFSIRSYEIGADKTASIETLMNHLQETALNHAKTVGLLGDGFGSTPEMCKKNLIWVVTRMHVLVDRYPTWGDNVRVDAWASSSGKNGMRRDWRVLDCKTVCGC
ncbi:hypothetical protein V2J09_002422 [Rumex salicifolius]